MISNVFIIINLSIGMKQVPKYFGVIAVIAIFALATISGSIGEVDAVKSKGTAHTHITNSYGHKNIHKVCGAKLCSSGEDQDPKNEGRAN